MKEVLGPLACFGGLPAARLFSLVVDLLWLSYLKASKAITNAGKESRKAARSPEIYLLSLVVKLASYIYMGEYKRGRRGNILKVSGPNMEPEVYQAYVISKTGLVLLGIIPCLLAFPLLAVIVVVLAVMVYLKKQERTDELLARRREELEGELPRFASIIEQELENSRDVLSIVENYEKNIGEELVNGLKILVVDTRSSSYEAAFTRLEARISSLMLSDMVRGLIGVLRNDDRAIYFQMLSHDFKQMKLQRLKRETQKISPKIRVSSSLMLVCFIVTYLAIIVFGILRSMGSVFQKRKGRRRKDMSSVKSQTGMAEREVENRSGQKLSGTAREFLERYPRGPVFVITPGEYVHLAPEQTGSLLVGGVIFGSPCSWRECIQIRVGELLQQTVDSVNHADGTWYVLIRSCEPGVIPAGTSKEGMVCHV